MTDLNDELTAVLDKEVAILERGDFREGVRTPKSR